MENNSPSKPFSKPLDPEIVGDGARPQRGAGRRLLKGILVFVLVLVVLAALTVVFAPHIASSDKFRNSVVSSINGMKPGFELSIEDWRWRWLSPCRIDGISLKADDGSYEAKVESVELSKGLMYWASKKRQDFGTVAVKSPVVTVVEKTLGVKGVGAPEKPSGTSASTVEPASSAGNVKPASNPSSFQVNPFGKIVVTGGRAEVVRPGSPEVVVDGIETTMEFAGLEGALSISAGSVVPQVKGVERKSSERISATARFSSLQTLLKDPSKLVFNADIKVPAVDLSALDKFIPSKAARPVIGAGAAEAAFSARRGDDGRINIVGGATTSGVRLEGAALSGDTPSWDKASLDFDVSLGESDVKVAEISLDSPFAVFEASGEMALGARPSGVLTAKGVVDLAAIAAQLPATLKMQDGVSLKRGALVFEMEAEAREAGVHVFALLRCDGIDAIRSGAPLALDLPFTLGVNADLSPEGKPIGGTLSFKSTPAVLTVQGNDKEGSATGSADLGKLHAALTPVLKLGKEPKALGKLEGRGGWKRAGDDIELSGKIDGSSLKLAGKKPMEFSSASLAGSASISANGAGSIKKINAEVQVPFANANLTADEIVPATKELKNFSLDAEAEWGPLMELAGVKEEVPFADVATVSMAGNFADDSLKLDRFLAAAGPVGVSGEATLESLSTERLARASGLLDIDFNKLQTVVANKKIQGMKISGKSSRPFRLFMPLGDGNIYMKSNMSAALGAVVPALAGMGLDAKDAEINLTVSNGKAKIESGATVNEGKFSLVANAGIADEPPVVALPPNSRILDNAKITQDMLEQMFARVHPVLLGCAVMSGNVSMDVANFSAPLSPNVMNEMEWTAASTLRDTRLAASGILKEIADSLDFKQKDIYITNQTVNVVCRGGRFFPDPLDLEIDGQKLRVSGSVGIDGSLDYSMTVPLSEKLVGKEAFRYLKGKTMNFPITGTAKRPRIDSSALRAELRRLVAEVATDAVKEEIKGKVVEELRGRIKDDDVKKLEDALKRLGR